VIVKALLQRVDEACVRVGSDTVGKIGRGLVAFIGVAKGDTDNDLNFIADKMVNLRIFPDEEGKFNLSAMETSGELLVISQFTLIADTRKGRRPNFMEAAPPDQAEELFTRFIEKVSSYGLKVETGKFQQHMLVEIHNNGPVTIMLDSKEKFST
jgi:D-tyrosyl-tRNA(Tyr) deacylase